MVARCLLVLRKRFERIAKMPRRRQSSRASERSASRGKANRQLIRTIVLGTVAVSLAIVWLGEQYGIAAEESLSYLGSAALFVLLLVALAVAGFGGLLLLRRLIGGREEND